MKNDLQTIPSIDEVKQQVNSLLASYFDQKIADSSAMDEAYGLLWRSMAEVAQSGGKRLRPYLLLLTYMGLGGKDYKAVLPIAAAQELLHISLLMHDDIIDNDYLRHGKPNVAGMMRVKYLKSANQQEATHYSNGAALLAGDLLISGAHQLIMESSVTADQKLQAMLTMGKGIDIVAGGQLLDMESVMRPFDIEASLKVANYKTASYSFMVPLVIGAQLCGASQATIQHLKKLASNIGVGFQLADDLLGIYGDEAVTGKSAESDIREGKRTYLMAQAFAKSTSEQAKLLHDILGKHEIAAADFEKVREIVETCGAKQVTIDKIKECAEEAKHIIDALPLQAEAKQTFCAFVIKATERNH